MSGTLEEWLGRRAMQGKPREMARFLWLLNARGMNLTSLAVALRGKAAGGNGPRGRSALSEVLAGKRSGVRTWTDLKRILTAEEYDCIAAHAAAERGRLAEAGAKPPSAMERLRDENARLREENAELRRRLSEFEKAQQRIDVEQCST